MSDDDITFFGGCVFFGANEEDTSVPAQHIVEPSAAFTVIEDEEGAKRAERIAMMMANCNTSGMGWPM